VSADIKVVDVTYAPVNATVAAYVVDPLLVSHPVSVVHDSKGLYSIDYTAALSGTHQLFVTAARDRWRGDSTSATFTVERASLLHPEVTGVPRVGQVETVTVTVHNEVAVPMVDASVTISGTGEYINRPTDDSGQAVFPLLASRGTAYEVWIKKPGYATTRLEIAVDPADVYLPLVIRNG
jgi:hypothetical protein